MDHKYSIVVWFGVHRWVQTTRNTQADALDAAKGTFNRLTKRRIQYNRGP